jgi:hypothetical protein
MPAGDPGGSEPRVTWRLRKEFLAPSGATRQRLASRGAPVTSAGATSLLPPETMRTHLLSIVPALLGTLAAQTYTYSPATASTNEENSNNTIPWWSATHRYQQCHADLRGTPRLIQALSIRRDGGLGAFASAVARTVNLSLVYARGNMGAFTPVFADNYVCAPTTVFTGNVNLPDWTMNLGSPAPWNVTITGTMPWVYDGRHDLIWELVINSTTSTGTYPADAISGPTPGTLGLGTNTPSGTGCMATGANNPMLLRGGCMSDGVNNDLDIGWWFDYGVPNAPSILMLGTTDPNQAVPGLCTNLRTNLLLTLSGRTDGSGCYTSSMFSVPWSPAFGGASLYAQGACADAGQSAAIKVSLTNGLQVTVNSAPSIGTPIRRVWVNNNTSTSGSLSETYWYGVVVRFTSP